MKKLLLILLLLFGCEDERTVDPVVENIQMWVNGDIIPVYDYYESITTLGISSHAHTAHHLLQPGGMSRSPSRSQSTQFGAASMSGAMLLMSWGK